MSSKMSKLLKHLYFLIVTAGLFWAITPSANAATVTVPASQGWHYSFVNNDTYYTTSTSMCSALVTFYNQASGGHDAPVTLVDCFVTEGRFLNWHVNNSSGNNIGGDSQPLSYFCPQGTLSTDVPYTCTYDDGQSSGSSSSGDTLTLDKTSGVPLWAVIISIGIVSLMGFGHAASFAGDRNT